MREQVISLYASQPRIQARAVSGWFNGWRWALVWATQLLFYGVPWLQWNGRQAVLFDLAARRFYIGPLVLYPQDFIYLTALLVVSAYALFLFTAVAGRLWCGYACPQTVYTEIFMWIEQRLEGDRNQRLKLDAAGLSADKLLRRGGKHLAWAAVSVWTGLSFVGYFTPIRELVAAVPAFALGPWELFWTGLYSLATYGNAGWLREQVCKHMCPYARFQSAMFDRDTLIIGYDERRGEPRGTRGRGADLQAAQLGHCIDCGLCVQVCPTGIDIRRGLQYECIGCAACIDVCNGVMDKMRYPRGLIRYDTLNGMQQQLARGVVWRRVLRPRVLVYSAVLVLVSGALLAGLASRPAVRVDVVRDRGVLSRGVEDGWVENVYRLQVMNTTEQVQSVRVLAHGLPGLVVQPAATLTLAGAQARWVPVALRIPPEVAASAGAGSHAIHFEVQAAGERPVIEKSSFMVPR